jgi:hypothetical protein
MTFRDLKDTESAEHFSPSYGDRFQSTRGVAHLGDFADLTGEPLPELVETPVEQLTDGDVIYQNAVGLCIVAKLGKFHIYTDGVLRIRCATLDAVRLFLAHKAPLQNTPEGIEQVMAAVKSWGK